jgi:TonB family protein
MLRSMPALRLLCTAIVLVLAVAIAPFHLQAASELEQHLRDQYKGKTLVLRGFYHGDRLSYDSGGMPTRSADPGDWTLDGFVRLDDVKVSSHRLTIQAERMRLGWTRDVGFSPGERSRGLRIEAELDPGEVTAEHADAIFAKIFLTTQDHFAELVPDYWKPCVRAGVTGKDSSRYACRFAKRLLAIPGVVSSPNANPESEQAADSEAKLSEGPAFRPRKDVIPPKPVFAPDPAFSEQARNANYQGTIVLLLLVDKTGQVRNIRIARPLGMGLDQKAVDAVSKWRFSPAKKDGEPVDYEMVVEVDFHLY